MAPAPCPPSPQAPTPPTRPRAVHAAPPPPAPWPRQRPPGPQARHKQCHHRQRQRQRTASSTSARNLASATSALHRHRPGRCDVHGHKRRLGARQPMLQRQPQDLRPVPPAPQAAALRHTPSPATGTVVTVLKAGRTGSASPKDGRRTRVRLPRHGGARLVTARL